MVHRNINLTGSKVQSTYLLYLSQYKRYMKIDTLNYLDKRFEDWK